MVYYNKDDLTNYSKNLGLNKVKAKLQPPTNKYYSENDLHEVEENSYSENEHSRISGRSRGAPKARSTMSLNSSVDR